MSEFKLGDKVYCPKIGIKVYTLEDTGCIFDNHPFPLRITINDLNYTYTKEGISYSGNKCKDLFHATKENKELLELLYGVEFEEPTEDQPTEAFDCCDGVGEEDNVGAVFTCMAGFPVNVDFFADMADELGVDVNFHEEAEHVIVDGRVRALLGKVVEYTTHYTLVNKYITDRFKAGDVAVPCYVSHTERYPDDSSYDCIAMITSIDEEPIGYVSSFDGSFYPYATPVNLILGSDHGNQ